MICFHFGSIIVNAVVNIHVHCFLCMRVFTALHTVMPYSAVALTVQLLVHTLSSRSPLHPKLAPLPKHTTGSTTLLLHNPETQPSSCMLLSTLPPPPHCSPHPAQLHQIEAWPQECFAFGKWSRINQAINSFTHSFPQFIFVELLD